MRKTPTARRAKTLEEPRSCNPGVDETGARGHGDLPAGVTCPDLAHRVRERTAGYCVLGQTSAAAAAAARGKCALQKKNWPAFIQNIATERPLQHKTRRCLVISLFVPFPRLQPPETSTAFQPPVL